MNPIQPGILAEVPPVARYLTFELAGDAVADALDREIPGLRALGTG